MSVLSSGDIRLKIKENKLIVNYDEGCLGSACYELRMGNVYYDLSEDNKRIELAYNQNVIIKPGHRVVLITKESVNMPDDVLARIVSKGSLFSIGLSAVSTTADPGFSGNIGIVTQNFSDKYLIIPQGDKIAKMDFCLLSSPEVNLYSGQHGFKTETWPIKYHLQKSHQDVAHDQRVFSDDIESHKILPKNISEALMNISTQQRKINFGLVIFLFVNILLLTAISTKIFEPVIAFIVNIITSVLLWLNVQLGRK